MSEIAIECTLCDTTFKSETEYSGHQCSAEENLDLLPIKEEPLDSYEMLEVECQLGEEDEDDPESTTIEVDPLSLLEQEDEMESVSGSLDDNSEIAESPNELNTPDDEAMDGDDGQDAIVLQCLNKYNCKLCGATYTRKDQFTKHFRTKHNSYRPHECKVCHKKFLHKHYVTLHMRVHTGEKPYACPLCPKAYSHKTSYTIHMRIHNGERPYACHVCGKKCYDKSGLTSHMRSHTKETPYQCEVCGRRFTHSKSLLVHRRNHTGEKPYVCSYCGKAFRHWHKHKIHVRLHTGERPYKCKVCGKGFPRNDEVSRHMKSHSGIKSFKCSICGVYCATQASITGHINLHHQNLKTESEEPPEKTLVQNSRTGILGSKVPEQRSIYNKVSFSSPQPKKDSQEEKHREIASSSGPSTSDCSIKSPTRVIEITTKDVPPLPIKSKKLQTSMPRTNLKVQSADESDEPPLNYKEFVAWQERMLANQGLVVKGVLDNNAAPKVKLPTILKTSSSLSGNTTKSDSSKPQYILISQGAGPTATKILLPLSMTGGIVTSSPPSGSSSSQSMLLMPSSSAGSNNNQSMFIMPNNGTQKMYMVAPRPNQNQEVDIKKEPESVVFDAPAIKLERPSPPASPTNSSLVTINGLSVSIKTEPPNNDI